MLSSIIMLFLFHFYLFSLFLSYLSLKDTFHNFGKDPRSLSFLAESYAKIDTNLSLFPVFMLS